MSTAVDAIWPPGVDSPPYSEDDDDIRYAFQALTVDEARALADRATRVLETRVSRRQYDEGDHARMAALELLIRLVCHVPRALENVYTRLIDVDALGSVSSWGPVPHLIFHDAGPEVADRLLAMDTHDSRLAVAWMAGEAHCETLVERGRAEASWPALQAGWVFGEDWASKLYHETSYRLRRGAGTEPVGAMLAGSERCGGCDDEMTTLFDIDLTDARVAFAGPGRRLTLPTCERCVCWGTVYATVDTEGGGSWSDASVRPTKIFDMGTPEGRQPMGLGPERPRPFTGLAFDVWRSSQLGGVPLWVQNPDYPNCPSCSGIMPYIGQVDMGQVDPYSEGVIFAFWSRGCGMAATVYQQT